MRRTTLVNHISQDEIRERMVTSKGREQYQRWQSIFLTKVQDLKKYCPWNQLLAMREGFV
jgi:hypothetical protein